MARRSLYGTVIVTYRCNARCNMCNCHLQPSRSDEEISLADINKLPQMKFTNITGGEPFIRRDLPEIIAALRPKTDRIVISTNGFFTDRILDLCRRFPKVGIRISIEGLEKTNDAIRGIPQGFARAFETLRVLTEQKHPDIGLGMTIQDQNAADLLPLYKLADELGLEFATATLHNSFYFKKLDNKIHNQAELAQNIAELIRQLLRSNSAKKWFRAYFNHGLINYIYGQPRLLPCAMGQDAFFIDPSCDVVPCNGMAEKAVMGNLHEQSWPEIWSSEKARQVRAMVQACERNCWMIGSAAPAMHRHIWRPTAWVLQHKFIGRGAYIFREEDYLAKS